MELIRKVDSDANGLKSIFSKPILIHFKKNQDSDSDDRSFISFNESIYLIKNEDLKIVKEEEYCLSYDIFKTHLLSKFEFIEDRAVLDVKGVPIYTGTDIYISIVETDNVYYEYNIFNEKFNRRKNYDDYKVLIKISVQLVDSALPAIDLSDDGIISTVKINLERKYRTMKNFISHKKYQNAIDLANQVISSFSKMNLDDLKFKLERFIEVKELLQSIILNKSFSIMHLSEELKNQKTVFINHYKDFHMQNIKCIINEYFSFFNPKDAPINDRDKKSLFRLSISLEKVGQIDNALMTLNVIDQEATLTNEELKIISDRRNMLQGLINLNNKFSTKKRRIEKFENCIKLT